MISFTDLGETQLAALARRVAPLCNPGDIICLSGPLGAGKTSFARALLHGLGLDMAADVPSPTYNLVLQYAPPDVRLPVAHIDLYRLDGAEQVRGLGLEDMMDDHLLIIEWPERFGDALPDPHLMIRISGADLRRTVICSGAPAWQHRLQGSSETP
jgi:tRNA threonylcarbamoyladenosine biosynthesis protein TsaE